MIGAAPSVRTGAPEARWARSSTSTTAASGQADAMHWRVQSSTWRPASNTASIAPSIDDPTATSIVTETSWRVGSVPTSRSSTARA